MLDWEIPTGLFARLLILPPSLFYYWTHLVNFKFQLLYFLALEFFNGFHFSVDIICLIIRTIFSFNY